VQSSQADSHLGRIVCVFKQMYSLSSGSFLKWIGEVSATSLLGGTSRASMTIGNRRIRSSHAVAVGVGKAVVTRHPLRASLAKTAGENH